ncbi:Uncharacterised protein [Bordetella pertussis]|nr:Uncharacterised protein [Bordetella pertussis]
MAGTDMANPQVNKAGGSTAQGSAGDKAVQK